MEIFNSYSIYWVVRFACVLIKILWWKKRVKKFIFFLVKAILQTVNFEWLSMLMSWKKWLPANEISAFMYAFIFLVNFIQWESHCHFWNEIYVYICVYFIDCGFLFFAFFFSFHIWFRKFRDLTHSAANNLFASRIH